MCIKFFEQFGLLTLAVLADLALFAMPAFTLGLIFLLAGVALIKRRNPLYLGLSRAQVMQSPIIRWGLPLVLGMSVPAFMISII